MAKCIPDVYGNADRKLLDRIEEARKEQMNGIFLPEFWKVGGTICTKLSNGYYHAYVPEKHPYTGDRILRDYRINKSGKLIYTENYYSVPTKEDFIAWCAERNIKEV